MTKIHILLDLLDCQMSTLALSDCYPPLYQVILFKHFLNFLTSNQHNSGLYYMTGAHTLP